jgi:hypothetical protein
MRHRQQPTRNELKQRISVVRRALIDADQGGMKVHDLLALLDEPNLTRETLAVWISGHRGRIQAVRGHRSVPGGYTWYHRGTPKAPAPAPAPAPAVRSAPTQPAPRPGRVITLTLPALPRPRITRLRAYALAMTLYAAALTALEVL